MTPLLEIDVPAGATYVEFNGQTNSSLPLASFFSVPRNANTVILDLNMIASSWFPLWGFDNDWFGDRGDNIWLHYPTIELLAADGVTRIGVTPKKAGLHSSTRNGPAVLSGYSYSPAPVTAPFGNMTINHRIPLPMNFAGGKLKFRMYPPVLRADVYGFCIEDHRGNGGVFDPLVASAGSVETLGYLTMLPATGSVNVKTDIGTLAGTITVPSPNLKEGFTGNIPIQFSVGNE